MRAPYYAINSPNRESAEHILSLLDREDTTEGTDYPTCADLKDYLGTLPGGYTGTVVPATDRRRIRRGLRDQRYRRNIRSTFDRTELAPSDGRRAMELGGVDDQYARQRAQRARLYKVAVQASTLTIVVVSLALALAGCSSEPEIVNSDEDSVTLAPESTIEFSVTRCLEAISPSSVIIGSDSPSTTINDELCSRKDPALCFHGNRALNSDTGEYCLIAGGEITYQGEVLVRGPAKGDVFSLQRGH
jgi:hypothetical protein